MDNVSGADPSTWVGGKPKNTNANIANVTNAVDISTLKEKKRASFNETKPMEIETMIDRMETFYKEHPDKNTYDLIMNLRVTRSTIYKLKQELE